MTSTFLENPNGKRMKITRPLTYFNRYEKWHICLLFVSIQSTDCSIHSVLQNIPLWARFKAEQERKGQIPYSECLAGEICERISAGEFTINICKEPDMPTMRSVNRWLREHSDFRALHDEAIGDRLKHFRGTSG
jgi:hypothetical protein